MAAYATVQHKAGLTDVHAQGDNGWLIALLRILEQTDASPPSAQTVDGVVTRLRTLLGDVNIVHQVEAMLNQTRERMLRGE